jgi:hypothetical protein
MGKMNVVLGVVLIVIALVLAGVGAFFMNQVSEAKKSGFPEDFDDHFVYGGYMDKLNLTTGAIKRTNFTVDRHIQVDAKLDDDTLKIEERITGKENVTGIAIPDLDKHNTYTVDKYDLYISDVSNNEGYQEQYTMDDKVRWIFPHPVEKKDSYIWNLNILNYSAAKYLGTEKRGGVDCYVFRGEEINYTVPLSAAQAAALPQGSYMKLSLWEKAWVHPETGTIVDYSKEIIQYLYLGPLPAVPEVKYPDDLNSTTRFVGNLKMFNAATYSFDEMVNVSAIRELIGSPYDDKLNITETVDVFDSDGFLIGILGSNITVQIDPATGAHSTVERSGQYLFPPTGVQKINYTFWDEGFGMEVTAVYTAEEGGLYVYNISVDEQPYLAGGIATLKMTYWVDPVTGIVVDAAKEVTNWRPQDARRLPLDTAMINKTMHFNTTITMVNPIDGSMSSMDLVTVQQVNCSGFTDLTFSTAKFEEKVWTEFPNGSIYKAPVVSKFGVEAKTMAYAEAPGWSTVTRTGVFTFPVGVLDAEGNVTEEYVLFNSDLGTSFPATLTAETTFLGRDAAVYTMTVSGVMLPEAAALMVTGPLPIPKTTLEYGCVFEYTVDIDTGKILNVERSIVYTLYPPTYNDLYFNMNRTVVHKGMLGTKNLTMTANIIGEELTPNIALITITTSIAYDNGSYFLPPKVSSFPLNLTTHMVLDGTMAPTGLFWSFPVGPDTETPAAYPMALPFADKTLIGLTMLKTYNETAIRYTWFNSTIMDAGVFNPGFIGMGFNVTVNTTQEWIVDKSTGAILDTNITILVDDGIYEIAMKATPQTLMEFAMTNKVVGWALTGAGVPIVIIGVTLFTTEGMMAAGQAGALSNALLVADGKEPALELSLRFDGTTVAQQKAMVSATKAKLNLLGQLKMAHALNGLLKSKGNEVAFIYYKQVPDDIDENKGSVKYWGDFAKEKENQMTLFGTTIPLALFALAVILVIAAISFFLMRPKDEDVPPEE